MKHLTAGVLICALLLCFAGCAAQQQLPQQPVNFYYRQNPDSIRYDAPIVLPERREAAGYADSLSALLALYLRGPISETLTSPFPPGTRLLSVKSEDALVTLQLNTGFADLHGMDLTLACACLTMTCLDLTDAQQVRISVPEALLDGAKSVTMDRSALLLLENSAHSDTN